MRREPLLAALLCLVGAFLVLVASGRAWVAVELAGNQVLPARSVAVTGSDLVSGLSALGLTGLAGVLALAATRGRGRLVVGGVLLTVGATVVGTVVQRASAGLADAALRSEPVQEAGPQIASTSATVWPWVALLGGLLLAAAGLLVALRGRRWDALGRRYDAPAAQAAAPPGERDLWEALDRGDDPTAGADPGEVGPAPRG